MQSNTVRIATFLVVALSLATVASAQVYINEHCGDPFGAVTGIDANLDGVAATSVSQSNDEFVEIVNFGPGVVDISNWTVSDAVLVRHTFAAGTMLPVGGAITVFGGGDVTNFNTIAAGVVASTGTLGLNNGAETIFLRDASATLIDSVMYASALNGESSTRSPEAPGSAFVAMSSLLPGTLHTAGYLNDGVTPYPGLFMPPMIAYPGNGTDASIEVRVNGTIDSNVPNIHVVDAGDTISLRFFSTMGTLDHAPVIGAFQLYNTATPTAPIMLPGDAAPAVWLDPVIGEVLFDGFSCVGFLFCPTLLPGGLTLGGQLPMSIGGSGKSIMIQCFPLDPGRNFVNVGATDAHELRIN